MSTNGTPKGHRLLAPQLGRLPEHLEIVEFFAPRRPLGHLRRRTLFVYEAFCNARWFSYRVTSHGRYTQQSKLMRAPYGLEIIESCLSCPHREERLFCNLSGPALEALASITSPASYPKGATLYVEGQSPRGVFIVCSGRVKLSTSSADGRTLILRIAESGDVLGMPGTLTGKPYELTADVLEPTQANFIHRQDFLNFLRDHGEAALSVAQQLGEIYHSAVSEMRSIGLSHSVAEKLARFLLDLSAQPGSEKEEVKLTLTLTHEEIAQAIGASRETVTRVFTDFKKKEFLQVKGSAVIIKNRAGLENLLAP